MLSTFSRRVVGVAGALAAATGALAVAAPVASAAPSAGTCHTQLATAGIRV